MTEDRFLTTAEVAERYRLSESALYTQRHRGESPGALGVRVGRKILYRLSDLEAWWDRQKVKAAR